SDVCSSDLIGNTDAEKEVLNRIADITNLQEFFTIRMINIEICRKCTATNTALRDRFHRRIKELHKTHRAATFTIIRHRTATLPKMSKIAGGSAADFSLHNHFTQFMGNAFDSIRQAHIKTGDWQSSLRSHICPNW